MRTSWTKAAALGFVLTGGLAHPAAGGGLSGTLRDATTGLPVSDVYVEVYNSNGVEVGGEWTNTAGFYACDGLSAGSYYVRTSIWSSSSREYIDELYDGIACPFGSCEVTSGRPVHVTAEATTQGVDFALTPGGRIRGTVTDAETGLPLASVYVTIHTASGSWAADGNTDSAGAYSSRGQLPTGSYFARTTNSRGYFDELYAEVSCLFGTCTVTGGTPIGVTAGATTTGIDFALSPGGRVSATVTDGLSGLPLADVNIWVYEWAGGPVTSGRTDSSGTFMSAEGLRTGTYYARTSNWQGYVDELYNDLPCMAGLCTATRGAPIRVIAGATTTGISFALQQGGRISGRVLLGGAIADYEDHPVSVRIYDTSGGQVASTMVDASGSYTTAGGLATGTYYAQASAWGHLGELYDGIPCPLNQCAVTSGTPITVTAGATTSGIDFDLTPGGEISGTVTDLATSLPLAYGHVEVFDSSGSEVTRAYTDGSGHYTTSSVAPGTYYARATEQGSLDELYDDIPCHRGWCTVTDGTPITVAAGTPTTGIDFALTRGGSVSGTVTDAATGLPLADALVSIWDSTGLGLPASDARTDSSGAYTTVQPLTSGTYYATAATGGYVTEVYDDIPSPGRCTVISGTPIGVTAGVTTTGIDFALAAGGGIGGTVRDAGTGLPLAGVWVYVSDSAGCSVASARTDTSGVYTTDLRLPSGTYFARTGNRLGYLDELYDGIACPTCTVTTGTPISVTAGATTSGIDFGLMARGRIAGTVRDTATGLPLPGVRVAIYYSAGYFAAYAYSRETGAWATDVSLLPGTYYARTDDTPGYVDELYDDVACPDDTCPVTTGQPIGVTAAATTTGIDFALGRGGQIGGTVKDASTGLPLSYVDVRIYNASGSHVATTFTNALGVYTSAGRHGLVSGTYYVRTSNSLGYVDELHAGIPCPGESCPVTVGTPVLVSAGATTGGIDFALSSGGRISSVVRDAATGQSLEGVEVSIHDAGGHRLTSGSTDSSGVYTSDAALVSGTYYARTSNALGYSDELYDDVPCPGGACTVTSGKPIVVTAGAPATNIVFLLAAGGGVSGNVTAAGTGQPVPGAKVRIYDSAGRSVTSGSTDDAGAWTASVALPSGTYYARTDGAPGYLDELYDGIPCPLGVCTVTSGTPIDVAAGATTTGVDFALDPSPGASFYSVTPCRVLDTRQPGGPTGGQPLGAGAERIFAVSGACGIPSTAKAVSLNVTVTQPTHAGNVRLYPSGAPVPSTSNVNFTPGLTRAGNATMALNASGEVAVLASPSGTVHLVLDVSGYYE
jgi:hypothetical protein